DGCRAGVGVPPKGMRGGSGPAPAGARIIGAVEARRQPLAARRYVHAFDAGVADPAILGGKGASLARMSALGIPTPPGFTIGTDGWRAYVQNERSMPDRIMAEVESAMAALQEELGRRFGDAEDPL